MVLLDKVEKHNLLSIKQISEFLPITIVFATISWHFNNKCSLNCLKVLALYKLGTVTWKFRNLINLYPL